jgi:hypothetical protein
VPRKSKINYFFLLLFSYIIGLAQPVQLSQAQGTSNPKPIKDLTQLPANYGKWRNDLLQTQNLVSILKHDTCLNKKFSIVFYIIDDSSKTFSNPLTYPTNLNNFIANSLVPTINTLNNIFKRICVSFQNCSTVIIPHHPYNAWTPQIIEPIVTSNWYTTKTINFYLPQGITSVGGVNNSTGYTYMPGSPGVNKDIIVMARGQLTNTVTLLHFFGHFFGLPNTHDEIGSPAIPGPIPPAISNEYVDRTNCYMNGDGFCDTEADSYPSGFNYLVPPVPVCHYDYGPVDGLGKYYTPPVDNFMSEYNGTCRCKFTQEQFNFMARVMITSKFYLH